MPTNASVALRWIYCLAVASAVFPLGVSGWVTATLGPSPLTTVRFVGPLAFLALGLLRIYQVAADRERLDSFEIHGLVRVLRILGIIAMTVGVLYLILQLSYRPLVRILVKQPSDNGIEFYIAGVFIGMAAGVGPLGILLFELSRLLGFERKAKVG